MRHEAAGQVINKWRDYFRDPAGPVRVIRAPLRICPVGAHVDHQYGRLIGMAIDRALYLAFVPRQEPRIRLHSDLYQRSVEIELNEALDPVPKHWSSFPRGAAWVLRQQGNRVSRGWDGYLMADTPVGGLASSAALGLSCLMATEEANGLSLSRKENVLLHYQLERDFVGVSIGLNDPTMIAHSEKECILHLDCLREEWGRVRWGGAEEPSWCLLYSGAERSLVDTAYNLRVEECCEAATRLAALDGQDLDGSPGLGKIPRSVYEQHGEALPPALQRRARHFYTEVERVEQALRCWSEGDLEGLGRLMNASCQSSVDNYECGKAPLIDLAQCAREAPGCYGSRFSGGGFGGFCIALIDPGQREAALEHIRRQYATRQPECAGRYRAYVCHKDDGIELLPGFPPGDEAGQ